MGSFRHGAIYAVDAHGRVSLRVDDSRRCSVLGIVVDGARDRLWVVNSDVGASLKPSAAGPKKLAAVGVYSLATGKSQTYLDLAPLFAGPHLLNEYGAGAVAPVHIHPALGIGFVLEGSFESAFGDEPVMLVQSGQAFTDPAGITHRLFRNPSPDRPLRFVIAYTIRAEEPQFYAGPVLPASSPPK